MACWHKQVCPSVPGADSRLMKVDSVPNEISSRPKSFPPKAALQIIDVNISGCRSRPGSPGAVKPCPIICGSGGFTMVRENRGRPDKRSVYAEPLIVHYCRHCLNSLPMQRKIIRCIWKNIDGLFPYYKCIAMPVNQHEVSCPLVLPVWSCPQKLV